MRQKLKNLMPMLRTMQHKKKFFYNKHPAEYKFNLLQRGSYRGFATARVLNSSVLPFSKPRVHSSQRIGPHNYDIMCILIGSLLGSTHPCCAYNYQTPGSP